MRRYRCELADLRPATAWEWRETSWPTNRTQAAVEIKPGSAGTDSCGSDMKLVIDSITVE
jgi:hypothetical protein